MSASHGQGETDECGTHQEQGTGLGHWPNRQWFTVGGRTGRNNRGRSHCERCGHRGRRLQLGEARTKKKANDEGVCCEVHGRPQRMQNKGEWRFGTARATRPASYLPTLIPQGEGQHFYRVGQLLRSNSARRGLPTNASVRYLLLLAARESLSTFRSCLVSGRPPAALPREESPGSQGQGGG